MFLIISVNAQNDVSEDSVKSRSIKVNSLAFGGTGLLFTHVNQQFTIMTGGRGAAILNDRFTIGGAGWGMPKGVELMNLKKDSFEFFKFGYGGPEIGYILYPGKKLKFGTNLLLAYGAGFKETVPRVKNSDFKMFPVIEPSLYTQIALGKLFRLDMGLRYRWVAVSKFSYISRHQLSGFSCYLALLASSCPCD